jgi:septum site-determining protein MinC
MSEPLSVGQMVEEAAPCELRQAQFGLFLLRIYEPDWWAVQGYVADRVGNAPGLLERAAVVLDVDQLRPWPSAEQAADLLARLRAAGVRPIALATDPGEAAQELALLFGLPAIPTERGRRRGRSDEQPAAERALADPDAMAPATVLESAARIETVNASAEPVAAPAKAPAAPVPTAQPATPVSPMYVTQPVRSGQQLYARGRDLVVTATVSPGAEVIADGSIHVYGRLAGKALAGARGDEQARIHCLDFQPELVSIAGHYRLLESIPEASRGRAVQVMLEGERLEIRPLLRAT